MPYIKQGNRQYLDDGIESLARSITALSTVADRAGNLNYTITRLIDQLYDLRYAEINEAVGVLECVKQEYYRKVAAKYEDEKAILNGEVYTKL